MNGVDALCRWIGLLGPTLRGAIEHNYILNPLCEFKELFPSREVLGEDKGVKG